MKLKAVLLEPAVLEATLHCMEKLGSECVINFTPKSVFLMMSNDNTHGDEVFISINSAFLFGEDYIVTSLQENIISIKASIPNFIRAVHSCIHAYSGVLKLTKKQGRACLSFEIQKSFQDCTFISQDLPIQIVDIKSLKKEPKFSEVHATFSMPPKGKVLSKLLDKFKQFSNEVNIESDNLGNVAFSVSTDTLNINSQFQGWKLGDEESSQVVDNNSKFKVTIHLKKFINALNCLQMNPISVIGCLVVAKAFIVNCLVHEKNVHMTYYVPVILSD